MYMFHIGVGTAVVTHHRFLGRLILHPLIWMKSDFIALTYVQRYLLSLDSSKYENPHPQFWNPNKDRVKIKIFYMIPFSIALFKRAWQTLKSAIGIFFTKKN